MYRLFAGTIGGETNSGPGVGTAGNATTQFGGKRTLSRSWLRGKLSARSCGPFPRPLLFLKPAGYALTADVPTRDLPRATRLLGKQNGVVSCPLPVC